MPTSDAEKLAKLHTAFKWSELEDSKFRVLITKGVVVAKKGSVERRV